MFREPEDADIDVVGWPWHGLIVDGVLTLPSGRTMPIFYSSGFGFNDTCLWDIGMPEPVYAAEDPDESWLGKAIIRGGQYFYSGGDLAWPTIAPQYSRPPVYLAGTVHRARDLAVTSLPAGGGVWLVRAEIYVDGVRYQSNTISTTDIGLAVGTFSDFTPRFIDHRWDRARWLITASVAQGSGARRVALIEATLTDAEGGIGFELELLEGNASFETLEVTLDEPVNIPESQRHDGGTADGEPLAGVYTAKRAGRFLVTAFYKLDASIERVYLHIDAQSVFDTTDFSQPIATRTWRNSGEIWLQCSLGTTSAINFECSMSAYREIVPPDSSIGTITRTEKINGTTILVRETEGFAGNGFAFGDVPAWPSWSQLTDNVDVMLGRVGRFGSALSVGLASVANNIHQVGATVTWFPAGLPTARVAERSSAITPSGVDPDTASFDSRVSTALNAFARFSSGSYNPITGQVIRNDHAHYYSWV